jgi:feruloyl esterase
MGDNIRSISLVHTNPFHSIIEDPDLCHPNFESILCNNNNTTSSSTTYLPTCLTSSQISRINLVYSPLTSPNGTLLYPRMQPGSELLAATTLYSGTPYPSSVDWFRYVVFSNPHWNPTTLTLSDIAHARSQDPFTISTWDGDLSPFRKAGGKLLHYHGLQDQAITSDNSARYYRKVARTMNLAPKALDEFYRYFRISGMGHCNRGPGAWEIGAYATGGSVLKTRTEPEGNVLMAVVEWVEQGRVPEFVSGVKYVGDQAERGVAFERRHCRFPRRNVYVGVEGGYGNQDGWECQLDGIGDGR